MDRLRIIPLGGLDLVGMNCTVFEYGEDIIVVDCGVTFPTADTPGIDLVIPDMTYLQENAERIRGFIITHAHEDHMGALPYVLGELPFPLYATRLTLALIENRLSEYTLPDIEMHEVSYGETVSLGAFQIEFIRVNHSIADTAALAITTPVGVVVHTGDFKIDYSPVYGETTDLPRFAELGRAGVLAMLCDSTNALREGFTMSERRVGRRFDNIFADNRESRVIIATFASNVDRLQQILNLAAKYERKAAIDGRSMISMVRTAEEQGYLKIPENTLIEMEEVNDYPPEKVVLLITGSQGEPMAALSRIARDVHRNVRIMPGDLVIFSSRTIPGNEKAITRIVNELTMKGAKVVTEDVHVSGHACQEEIKLLYSLVKPRYCIPVHGEPRHLKAQKDVLRQLDYPSEDIFLLSPGDVLSLDAESAAVTDEVPAGKVYVDGLGVGDVGSVVIKDRQSLAQNGIIVAVIAVDRESMTLAAQPELVTRGFVYIKESEDLLEETREVFESIVEDFLEHGRGNWARLKVLVRDGLSDHIWRAIKRRPMILPIVVEV